MYYLKLIRYNEYDRVFQYGHFSLYKNTHNINNHFQDSKQEFPLASMDFVKKTSHACFYDEYGSVYSFLDKGLKIYRYRVMADIDVQYNRMVPGMVNPKIPHLITYENGAIFLYSLYDDRIEKREYMYTHFQKRRVACKEVRSESFIISHKGFIPFDGVVTKGIIDAVNDDPLTVVAPPVWYTPAYKRIWNIIKGDFPIKGLLFWNTIWGLYKSKAFQKNISLPIGCYDELKGKIEVININ